MIYTPRIEKTARNVVRGITQDYMKTVSINALWYINALNGHQKCYRSYLKFIALIIAVIFKFVYASL